MFFFISYFFFRNKLKRQGFRPQIILVCTLWYTFCGKNIGNSLYLFYLIYNEKKILFFYRQYNCCQLRVRIELFIKEVKTIEGDGGFDGLEANHHLQLVFIQALFRKNCRSVQIKHCITSADVSQLHFTYTVGIGEFVFFIYVNNVVRTMRRRGYTVGQQQVQTNKKSNQPGRAVI